LYSKSAQDATAALVVTFLPTTFFADGAGVIRSRVRHALTLEELEAAVQAQLK
jgi:hypothetical protein